MVYHSVACLEDFSGTIVSKVPCIDYLNLEKEKEIWAVENLQKCIKYIKETQW